MTTKKHTIKLSPTLERLAREIAQENDGRKSNWRGSIPATEGKIGRVHSFNCGRYSAKCTYTKWEYAASVRAWGTILPNGDLVGLISKEKFRLTPRRGYKWDVDANGLRLMALARPDDDYHPNTDDIEAGMTALVAKLRANANTRKAARKAAKMDAKKSREVAQQAKAMGVRVVVADSIRAGNCESGTLSFCQRHGFDPRKSYTPEQVLAKSNGDTQRARLAIHAAIKRHETMTSLGATVYYP